MDRASLLLGVGAASSAVSVALGAMGAHALKTRLDATALAAFQTGVEYQFFHSLAVCLIAVLAMVLPDTQATASRGMLVMVGYAFVAGIVLFSGSLYGLSLGGPRWLGPVTPLGGVAFIFGWLALAYWGLRRAFA